MNIYNIDNVNCLPSGCIATVGDFDGLHRGHVHILDKLVAIADERHLTPVVVTFDLHPRIVLGSAGPDFRLLSASLYERLNAIRSFGIRHLLLLHFTPQLAQLSACDFLDKCICGRMDLRGLLLGYDNVFGNKRSNDFDRLDSYAAERGFEIFHDGSVLCQGIEISSTQIRNALRKGDLSMAQAMLGRPFAVRGVVIPGRQLGRSIDFPTANIAVANPYQACPADGVYAVRVWHQGRSYPGMANLGQRPTVGDDGRSLEVHIVGFQGNLYGLPLTVEFVSFLRPIVCFASVAALAQQLRDDLCRVKSLFDV